MNDAARTVVVSVDESWDGSWTGPRTFSLVDDVLFPVRDSAAIDDPIRVHLPGTLFPQLIDHHVHLGLIDPRLLVPNGITVAHDLGWVPEIAELWSDQGADRSQEMPTVLIAGAFLTSAGGYPIRSSWAPRAACVEVSDRTGAITAVDDQVRSGASFIKIALNSTVGPVLDDDVLDTIITKAHDAGLPAIVHAEGDGQAGRALRAGADLLAHAPFSERLDDPVIEQMAASLRWISTLDIHGFDTQGFDTHGLGIHRSDATTRHATIAADNVHRFVAAGGTVLYGTDLGNGPLPVGVNERELAALAAAGLDRDALVTAIAGPADGQPAMELNGRRMPAIGPRFAWVPGLPPQTARQTAHWLATARGQTTTALADPTLEASS